METLKSRTTKEIMTIAYIVMLVIAVVAVNI